MIELSADTTLYVRADGNDANDGSSNTPAGAFATLQAAYDYACNTFFLRGHKLTIQIGDGQFVGLTTSRAVLGADHPDYVTIRGNGDSTALLQGAGQACVHVGNGETGNAKLTVTNLTLYAPAGYGLLAFGGGCAIHYGCIRFNTCGPAHIAASHNSWVYQKENQPCVVAGGAQAHISVNTNAIVATHGGTLTFQNSPNFSYAFVSAVGGGRAYPWPMTYNGAGSVTGSKFAIGPGSAIDGGGNANNLAGNAAGTNNQGWYI
ncbi:hypothetical protein [Herbaspirillum huttiense]|uniref:hypothetical protein n=1 Tax=Herbaspirillum huttiense TaxID=863372 RepID=UPI0031D8C4E9